MELADFKTREIEIIEELQINEQNSNQLQTALAESAVNRNVSIGRLQEVRKWIEEEEALIVPTEKKQKNKI